uniref:Uncharacterized protein n=1 Tax=Peronospora matthiolae TaxID=2874970 RepID=A0AAV1TQY5_9STRA
MGGDRETADEIGVSANPSANLVVEAEERRRKEERDRDSAMSMASSANSMEPSLSRARDAKGKRARVCVCVRRVITDGSLVTVLSLDDVLVVRAEILGNSRRGRDACRDLE